MYCIPNGGGLHYIHLSVTSLEIPIQKIPIVIAWKQDFLCNNIVNINANANEYNIDDGKYSIAPILKYDGDLYLYNQNSNILSNFLINNPFYSYGMSF